MRSEHVDERLLVKYLLGSLSEEEQAQVEHRAFADVRYLGALEAAEADLIDAYVRDELSQPERTAFERRFMVSTGRRGKVEFARALARVSSEHRALERPTAWQVLWGLVSGWSPPVRFAAGLATLIFAAGALWLVARDHEMRSRMADLEAHRRALEMTEQSLRRELAIESQKQQSPPAIGAPLPVVASLLFLSGPTRTGTQMEQLLLNSSAQIAHVQIQLEPRDDYPKFRVEIRTRSGEEVLTEGNLPRRRTEAGYSVSFDVPASAFAAGQYELAVKGILDDQSVQDVGYYNFSVQRH
jgi:hypothetical protein